MSEFAHTSLEYPPITEKKQSIFEHYSVLNDIIFVHGENLPISEKRFYLEANVMKFLAEYVGEVPYTKIPLALKANGFEFAGINTSEAYWKTAVASGKDSREYSDFIGYDKIQRSFTSCKSNVAAWISPPITGNYGFVFLFTKTGDHVDEYILRYKEKKGELVSSNHILSSVLPGKQYQRSQDFVEDPIAISATDIDLCVQKIMVLTGISPDAIQSSLDFEDKVNRKLKSWINLYIDKIIALSEEKYMSIDIYKEREAELQMILAGIFNRAKDLKENKKVDIEREFSNSYISGEINNNNYLTEMQAIYTAAQSRPVTVSGGSCPVTKSKQNGFESQVFVSTYDIIEALRAGQTVESFFKSLNTDDSDSDYEYHEGYCVACEDPENKVKKEVGPCNICRKCVEEKFS